MRSNFDFWAFFPEVMPEYDVLGVMDVPGSYQQH